MTAAPKIFDTPPRFAWVHNDNDKFPIAYHELELCK